MVQLPPRAEMIRTQWYLLCSENKVKIFPPPSFYSPRMNYWTILAAPSGLTWTTVEKRLIHSDNKQTGATPNINLQAKRWDSEAVHHSEKQADAAGQLAGQAGHLSGILAVLELLMDDLWRQYLSHQTPVFSFNLKRVLPLCISQTPAPVEPVQTVKRSVIAPEKPLSWYVNLYEPACCFTIYSSC